MTFYGKEPDAAMQKHLRTFTFTSASGEVETLDASYVEFMNDHVVFSLENEGTWDSLVLAKANRDVNDLREITK